MQPPTFDPSTLPAAERETFVALTDEAQRARLADFVEASDMPSLITYAKINPVRMQEIIVRLGNPQSGTRFDDALLKLFDVANTNAIDAVVAALDLAPGASVLEIGFGGGYGVALAVDRGFSVSGVEYSAAMLQAATVGRARDAIDAGQASLQQGDAAQLPYADATFDAVYHVNCYYFWPDLARGVAECFRVLKSGGVMLTGSKLAASTLLLGANGEFDVDNVFKNGDEAAYFDTLGSTGFTDVASEPHDGIEGQPITAFSIIRSHRP